MTLHPNETVAMATDIASRIGQTEPPVVPGLEPILGADFLRRVRAICDEEGYSDVITRFWLGLVVKEPANFGKWWFDDQARAGVSTAIDRAFEAKAMERQLDRG